MARIRAQDKQQKHSTLSRMIHNVRGNFGIILTWIIEVYFLLWVRHTSIRFHGWTRPFILSRASLLLWWSSLDLSIPSIVAPSPSLFSSRFYLFSFFKFLFKRNRNLFCEWESTQDRIFKQHGSRLSSKSDNRK